LEDDKKIGEREDLKSRTFHGNEPLTMQTQRHQGETGEGQKGDTQKIVIKHLIIRKNIRETKGRGARKKKI